MAKRKNKRGRPGREPVLPAARVWDLAGQYSTVAVKVGDEVVATVDVQHLSAREGSDAMKEHGEAGLPKLYYEAVLTPWETIDLRHVSAVQVAVSRFFSEPLLTALGGSIPSETTEATATTSTSSGEPTSPDRASEGGEFTESPSTS